MAVFILVAILGILLASVSALAFAGSRLDRRSAGGRYGALGGAMLGAVIGGLIVLQTFYESFFGALRLDIDPAPGCDHEWIALIQDARAPARLGNPWFIARLRVPASGVVRLADLESLLGRDTMAYLPGDALVSEIAVGRAGSSGSPSVVMLLRVRDDGDPSNDPPPDHRIDAWLAERER